MKNIGKLEAQGAAVTDRIIRQDRQVLAHLRRLLAILQEQFISPRAKAAR